MQVSAPRPLVEYYHTIQLWISCTPGPFATVPGTLLRILLASIRKSGIETRVRLIECFSVLVFPSEAVLYMVLGDTQPVRAVELVV